MLKLGTVGAQMVNYFYQKMGKQESAYTPPRTHRISGLKSQVLKPTFLAEKSLLQFDKKSFL